MRQIYVKCHEYNTDLHNIFIDFSQAFDTVNRDVIFNSLIKHNVPDKLIKLIKPTMQRTKMKVKVNKLFWKVWDENRSQTGRPSICTIIQCSDDSVITRFRSPRKNNYKIKTDLGLCRWHCNNWKNKTNFNWHFL